jgi:RecA-family ATPase
MSGYQDKAQKLIEAGFLPAPKGKPLERDANAQTAKGSTIITCNEYSTPPGVCQEFDVKNFFVTADKVVTRSVPWLIKDFLVRGALNGVQGLQGDGKSWLLSCLASQIADGGLWVNGCGELERIEQGRVLLLNFDDSVEYTIVNRLIDCGCKHLENIPIVGAEKGAGLTFNDKRLERLFEEVKPDLAIFDTLQHFIGGVDMHRANEINAALCDLQTLAARYNTAVVLVEHISKQAANGNAGRAVNWALGSAAIAGLMRTVWTVGELQGGEYEAGTRAIFCSKANLIANKPPARLFQIRSELGGILWCGVDYDVTERDLIAVNRRGRPDDKREQAKEIILNTLQANGGRMCTSDFEGLIKADGVNWSMFRRVKNDLNIVEERDGNTHFVKLALAQK